MKCKHKSVTGSLINDNLEGKYYEWICNDCGYKKGEGRSCAHKEICEYASRLKGIAKGESIEEALQCLSIMNKMAIDAIHRLSDESDSERYFKEVF